MSDSNFLKRILLAMAGRATLFRNNTGTAWTGHDVTMIKFKTVVHVGPGDAVIRGARPLHAGLIKGSSDLIGWTKRKIVQSDVGKVFAIFTALEGKQGKDRLSTDQKNFLTQVREAGGIAAEVRSVDDAVAAVMSEVLV